MTTSRKPLSSDPSLPETRDDRCPDIRKDDASIKKDEGGKYVSLYKDEIATVDDVKVALAKLASAFKLEKPFLSMLAEALIRNSFTRKRLSDAVNSLIDAHTYPSFTIADVIRFDKKMKLYSHADVCNLIPSGYTFEDFEHVWINGKLYWKKKNEE